MHQKTLVINFQVVPFRCCLVFEILMKQMKSKTEIFSRQINIYREIAKNLAYDKIL